MQPCAARRFHVVRSRHFRGPHLKHLMSLKPVLSKSFAVLRNLFRCVQPIVDGFSVPLIRLTQFHSRIPATVATAAMFMRPLWHLFPTQFLTTHCLLLSAPKFAPRLFLASMASSSYAAPQSSQPQPASSQLQLAPRRFRHLPTTGSFLIFSFFPPSAFLQ